MLREHDIKEFTGEAGDVPRALLKSKTVIAGSTPVNSFCVLEMHERYGSSKPEDRMKAKEMQQMLDERLPERQDFNTWAMGADMKLADLRLLGDAFEDKTVINGIIGKLKNSAEPWPQVAMLTIFKMNQLAENGARKFSGQVYREVDSPNLNNVTLLT